MGCSFYRYESKSNKNTRSLGMGMLNPAPAETGTSFVQRLSEMLVGNLALAVLLFRANRLLNRAKLTKGART
jgi:hypothetical protein